MLLERNRRSELPSTKESGEGIITEGRLKAGFERDYGLGCCLIVELSHVLHDCNRPGGYVFKHGRGTSEAKLCRTSDWCSYWLGHVWTDLVG